MSPRFVKVASSLGLLDVWMAPFISVPAGAVPSRAAIRRRMKPFTESGCLVIPQILGRDPEAMADCAMRMASLGHDFISLNFACPSPAVLRGGSGGAMLKKPEMLLRCVEMAAKSVDGKASLIVKLRSGWDSSSLMESMIPSVRDAGAEACILHYRTVQERYNPVEDGLSRISRAVELAGTMPLIGNGDIRSAEDAWHMRSLTRCAGVAVARGFLADPFLLRRILGRDAPPLEEGRKLFLDAMRDAEGKLVKGNLLEIAKEMYGERSESFKTLLKAMA